MNNTKQKLWKFNFGAAILGIFWAFKNNCQNEYLSIFTLSVLVVPGSILTLGLFLIFTFVPSANMANLALAIAWLLDDGPTILLVALIICSTYVGFRANKWVIKNAKNEDIENIIKKNNKWNKIGLTVFLIGFFIISCLRIIPLHSFDTKMLREDEQNCQILMETYQKVYEKNGNNFSNEDFVQILNSNPSVTTPAYVSKYSPIIDLRINNIPIEFTIRKFPTCNLLSEDCYVYVKTSACQFFFDNNGKMELSQYTKEKYKNIK